MLLREIFLVRFGVAYYAETRLVKPPPPSNLSLCPVDLTHWKSNFQKSQHFKLFKIILAWFFSPSFTVLNHRCLGNSYQNKCFWLASLIAKIAVPPQVLTWNPCVVFWFFAPSSSTFRAIRWYMATTDITVDAAQLTDYQKHLPGVLEDGVWQELETTKCPQIVFLIILWKSKQEFNLVLCGCGWIIFTLGGGVGDALKVITAQLTGV